MNAFLFGVRFLSSVTLDMGGSLLTFSAAMRALGDGTALFGNKKELTVWKLCEKLYALLGRNDSPVWVQPLTR